MERLDRFCEVLALGMHGVAYRQQEEGPWPLDQLTDAQRDWFYRQVAWEWERCESDPRNERWGITRETVLAALFYHFGVACPHDVAYRIYFLPDGRWWECQLCHAEQKGESERDRFRQAEARRQVKERTRSPLWASAVLSAPSALMTASRINRCATCGLLYDVYPRDPPELSECLTCMERRLLT